MPFDLFCTIILTSMFSRKIIGIFGISIFMVVGLSQCNTMDQKVNLDVSAKPFEFLSDYHFFSGNPIDFLPNKGVIPYDLNSPLFSDYAEKLRFVYVPEGKKALYNDTAVIDFPVGSCLIKTFYYPHDFRDKAKGRKIMETRILVRRENGWDALPYIWNDEQTDARLEVTGGSRRFHG